MIFRKQDQPEKKRKEVPSTTLRKGHGKEAVCLQVSTTVSAYIERWTERYFEGL